MKLKLFHITEFAQSQYLSPASQRTASYPVTLMLWASLWLAVPSNVVLWRELARIPDLGPGTPWAICIGLSALMAGVLCLGLTAFNWRWTLKPAITVLLLLAAVNGQLMLSKGITADGALLSQVLDQPKTQWKLLMSWPLVATVLLLGLAPVIWLWNIPVRRMSVLRNLQQNLMLILIFSTLLGALWWMNYEDIIPLLSNYPELTARMNPFNSFAAPFKSFFSGFQAE